MKRVILSNGMTAIVDDGDYDYVSKYSWHHNGVGYAYARLPGNERVILLHHLIAIRMSLCLTYKVDHVNTNRLDCCRQNLREATSPQNAANSSYYADIDDAAVAYNKAALHYFGVFAKLNEVPGR